MIDISPEVVAILMLGGVLLGVLVGYPIAIPIGAVALVMGYLMFGGSVLEIIYDRLFGLIMGYTFLAVPLFVFMGVMLERSGIAENMYAALYMWLGGLRGGLAIGTVLIGTILAACVGIIGASVTMLSLLAMPSMVNRGYSKSLASGSVCAGGCLGILIPPSIMLVVYGPMANVSVGKLFMGAFVPGLVLSALYVTYIAIRSYLQPKIAPPIPAKDREMPLGPKLSLLIKSLIPPGLLILSVLGAIFFGIAPPTEAAAIGALVATLLTVVYGRFSFKVLRETAIHTVKVSSMILLIGGMALAFSAIFLRAGGSAVVENMILATPGGKWGAFVAIMLLLFIMGFAIDWKGIVFILVPIVTPIGQALGFDPIWFALMIIVNLQMSFMTPPFAPSIFYLKASVAPELNVTIGDIIRGVFPFVGLVVIGLILFTIFPQLILWLPGVMIR